MMSKLSYVSRTMARLAMTCLMTAAAAPAAAIDITLPYELPIFFPVAPPPVTPPPSAPLPTSVRLTASTAAIHPHQVFTLTWNATNATWCTASGGWQGSLPTSGSRIVVAPTRQTSYSISCSGPGGSALSSTSVGVLTALQLRWSPPSHNEDGSVLTDLAGYRLYWGTQPGSYSNQMSIGNSLLTSQVVNLVSGTYYFAMTALDAEGHESRMSNEVIRIAP